MRKNHLKIIALSFALQIVLPGTGAQAVAQAGNAAYPSMAPLDQYLISDEKTEIALARSAAPSSISDGAEVMVLGREGYTTAVKGTNGFLCIVERSWGQSTDQAEFWNPKMRAPHCFNAQAWRSFAPIYLMKTKLVLAGKTKPEIARAIAGALEKKELPALEPGAMAYMMSKQQYLNDDGKSWHPHAMFFFVRSVAISYSNKSINRPLNAMQQSLKRKKKKGNTDTNTDTGTKISISQVKPSQTPFPSLHFE